ncbi:L-arabinose ABC transporter permease AraH [bacterium]|nr:L-arabinose ABC transporter permease AraH [bacterium]
MHKMLFTLWDRAGMALVFVLLFVGCCLFVPRFLTWYNMTGLALSVSMVGMVACTMLLCLASGDFDLSVESTVACSGVLAAVVINSIAPGPLAVAAGIAAGVLAGGVVGLFNGWVIAVLGINALITTLATMQIVRGLGFLVSGGSSVGISQPGFFALGQSSFLGFPTPVWITVACFVVFGLLLHKTVFGRNCLAIGGNAEAARLVGINVERTKLVIFTLQGLMAGLAGVVLASRITSGQPNTSAGFSLDVISACVLGGVSLSGGVGSILGVLVGVLIMGTVQNAMNLCNVPPFWQYIARGGILLAAVLFDQLKRGRRRNLI